MTNLRLKIVNEDRIGLVLDVSTILSKYHTNITHFTVLPNIMYLEADASDIKIQEKLIKEIQAIKQVTEVSKEALIPTSAASNETNNLSNAAVDAAFSAIIHSGHSMQKLIKTAKRAAQCASTVLLLGESGTGKELFAKAIHQASSRAKHAFLPINCAAIPDSLLESELFGYDDGAFTGANRAGKKGLFEEANNGTIFLDEIGELPMHFQVKLLRVLQEKKIKRVGGTKEIPIDVRIIAATHQNLSQKMQENQFRLDLFYRLNVLPLHIPPLRERREDIACLAQTLLDKKCQQFNLDKKSFSHEALNKLMQYSWPGNIRELENIIERLLYLNTHAILDANDIELEADIQFEDALSSCVIPNEMPSDKKLKDILADCERSVLCDAIKKYGTSRQIGKQLGISHTAVLNRIRKHNIYIKTEAI